jgi:hypothetical protein
MGSCKHSIEALFGMKCAQFVGWLLQGNPAALSVFIYIFGARSGAVVEALPYKPEDHWIDSRCCHWNFSLT